MPLTGVTYKLGLSFSGTSKPKRDAPYDICNFWRSSTLKTAIILSHVPACSQGHALASFKNRHDANHSPRPIQSTTMPEDLIVTLGSDETEVLSTGLSILQIIILHWLRIGKKILSGHKPYPLLRDTSTHQIFDKRQSLLSRLELLQ